MNTSHKTLMAAGLFSLLSSTALAQSSGIAWKNGNVLTAQQLQQLDNAKMNISSLGKPGFAPKLNALGQITNPVVGDVSQAKATQDGQTVVEVADKAANAVQKSDVGETVAPLDANKMMPSPVSGDTSASPATAKNASIGRPIAEHFGDYLDVRDFGAILDGKADDTAALQVVKDAAVNGQAIMVPPVAGSKNTLNLTAFPTSTADKINFWWLFGKTLPSGYPIFGLGYDPVFSTIGNGFWFHRDKSYPNSTPLIRIDTSFVDAGGDVGATSAAVSENCDVGNEQLNNFVWCHTTTMTSSSLGPSENVGNAIYVTRPKDALSDNKGARGEIWSLNTSVDDRTGMGARYSGSMVGHELDIFGSGVGGFDNTDFNELVGNRIGLQFAIHADTQAKAFGVGHGISLGGVGNAYYNYGIRAQAKMDRAAFSTLGMTPWTTTVMSSTDTPAGSKTITVPDSDNGIEVNQEISATGIPDGTTISSIDRTKNILTLSNPTTSDIPSNTTLTLTSHPAAFEMEDDQFLSFGKQRERRLSHSSSGTLNYFSNGKTRLLIGDTGDVVTNIDNPAGVGFSVQGSSTVGFATVNLNAPEALRMAEGQRISWEATASVRTSFKDGVLRDSNISGDVRSLDMNGNERLNGTITAKNLSMDNGSVITDGNGNLTVKSLIATAVSYSTLPTSAAVGQSVFCSDCYSKLREASDTQTGVVVYWNGSRWNDSMGIAIMH